jgi:hypothetical protein
LDGSPAVREQSDRFRPSASHLLSWAPGPQPGTTVLESRVTLAVELFASGAFRILPPAVMEKPGSMLLRRIISRNQPAFLDKLAASYSDFCEGRSAPPMKTAVS